jgi:hypothetical protein
MGKPEISGQLRSDRPLVRAWARAEIDGSLASSTAEIGADAEANISAGHRMVTKLGPLCGILERAEASGPSGDIVL